MPVVKCPGCTQRYDSGEPAEDLPKKLANKAVCPMCGQWVELPDLEMIHQPNAPKEVLKSIRTKARLLGKEKSANSKEDAKKEPARTTVTCPKCERKFKAKSNSAGKKILCAYCNHSFAVPTKEETAQAIQSGEPPTGGSNVVAAAPAPPPVDEFDGDNNPYNIGAADFAARCPNCVKEMGPEDIICLNCGYNTMTRSWGKTEKTVGVTFGQQLFHLLPALGASIFVFLSIVFLMYFCLVSPYHVDGVAILYLTDHESLRMWTTMIFLGWLWGAGVFCFKKFVEKPLPDEAKSE